MIREILEQNGEREQMPFITDFLNAFSDYTDVQFKEELKELACRQYVKENRFKEEWFDKETQHYYELADWDIKGLMALLCLHKYTDVKSLKLIAWLYANDIEII